MLALSNLAAECFAGCCLSRQFLFPSHRLSACPWSVARQLRALPDFCIMDLHCNAFACREDLCNWCRDLNLLPDGGRQELVCRLLQHSRRLDGDADAEFEDVDLNRKERHEDILAHSCTLIRLCNIGVSPTYGFVSLVHPS